MTYAQNTPATTTAEADRTGPTGRFPMIDIATGLLLTAFCAVFVGSAAPLLLASFGMTLPWIIRRVYPIAALTIATGASFAHLAASAQPSASIIAVPLLIYSYARWYDRRLARLSLAIGIVGSIAGPIRWLVQPVGLSGAPAALMTAIACAGVVCLAYVIGRFRRERAERAAQAVATRLERERLLRAEQEQRAQVATIDERNRIARELHDIVAHSLSVIVVQAEGGRALAAKKPEKAPEVLNTIAQTSREALQEMRQMVGLLRSGGTPGTPHQLPAGPGGGRPADGPDGYLPTPGLDDLGELVNKSNPGYTLTEYGERPAVSQALGLTVYRIVQESLTNVLKHAGPGARAAVGVTYAEHGIGIRVIDDGAAGKPTFRSGDRTGHGLRGMWERVAIHGGTFDAHPRPGGGFEVLAWLPYPPVGGRQPADGSRVTDDTMPYGPGYAAPHNTSRGTRYEAPHDSPYDTGYDTARDNQYNPYPQAPSQQTSNRTMGPRRDDRSRLAASDPCLPRRRPGPGPRRLPDVDRSRR